MEQTETKINEYTILRDKYTSEYLNLEKQYNRISYARLLVAFLFLGGVYLLFTIEGGLVLPIGLFLLLVLFFVLIKKHQSIESKKELRKTLITINAEEISYLKGERIPFAEGIEYNEAAHPYSYDLDIFGKSSLFHNLNRTATFIGKDKLAKLFLTKLPNPTILLNQEAIQELSTKIHFRQELLALAKLSGDTQNAYDKLTSWSAKKVDPPSKLLLFISYASPITLMLVLVGVFTTQIDGLTNVATTLYLFNLVVLMLQMKKIKKQITEIGKTHETIKQYGLILERIEREEFVASKLKSIKESLIIDGGFSSKHLRSLSSLYANIESIQNIFAALISNGLFLSHLHSMKALSEWNEKYAQHILIWLDSIGELEALNSMANLYYNNPDFSFPALNQNNEIVLKDLGHPLIRKEKRICNTVEFVSHKFIILTGSNMSGKSTFLRALGINMVLAGIGAPVCATMANVHPLNVLVYMRLSDSLDGNESYFFAEVKRLKSIVHQIESEVCFVLLDEILKGTNSDDKQTGTIEVLKKIIMKDAIGVIATHDLEVCHTANEYPGILVNKCFEVEIVNDALSFDYKLREGVCQNKSATFLMKKMGVI